MLDKLLMPKIEENSEGLRIRDVECLIDFSLGGGGCRYVTKLMLSCRPFVKETYIETLTSETYNFQDFLGLFVGVCDILDKKEKFDIVIKSKSPEARKSLLNFYSSLTEEDYEKVGINRYT